ncbi:rhodanese-like domain-containing protein [Bacillus benzoevorans]|uniref:Rhodanese-related sulfurtransferase n=1 Tax=Bacillus benzoevorans TaxID=1456 RepID=A0A7X0HT91_9BACI|nr:rhodanese-like domain-containing protein [Bacillus benzoevorans]MBB6445340.1 rhodanese-related sulfurtransferase [Bacillus benzoevorans]
MKQITATEVQNMLKSGSALNIIDVREVDEVAGGKVPGAVNIPLGLIQFKMNELDKNKEYIIVCRSGGRSGMAAQVLESYGYNVTNMIGGMMSWAGEME